MAIRAKRSGAQIWQCGVDPSELRNEVQLASRSSSTDAFNQPLNEWVSYLSTWAAIRLLKGSELYQNSEFTSAAQYKITIRHPGPDMTVSVGDRVTFGPHVYIVQLIENVEMRDFLLNLTCLELGGVS